MRVFALIAAWLLSSLLHSAENQGTPEVEPILQEKRNADSSPTKEGSGQNAKDEIRINLTAADFKALIDAIETSATEQYEGKKNNHIECDNSSLSYADFVSCKDLNAQQEMARVTTDIRDLTEEGIVISRLGLLFIFLSLLSAFAAAAYAKKAAEATELGNKITLQPYLTIESFELHWDLTLSTTPVLTVRLEIINKGNSIVTSITDIDISICNLSLVGIRENRFDFFTMSCIRGMHEGYVNAVLIPEATVNFRKAIELQPAGGDHSWSKSRGMEFDMPPLPSADIDEFYKARFSGEKFKKMIHVCDIKGDFSFSDRFTDKRTCKFSIERFVSSDNGATSDPFDPIRANIIEIDPETENKAKG